MVKPSNQNGSTTSIALTNEPSGHWSAASDATHTDAALDAHPHGAEGVAVHNNDAAPADFPESAAAAEAEAEADLLSADAAAREALAEEADDAAVAAAAADDVAGATVADHLAVAAHGHGLHEGAANATMLAADVDLRRRRSRAALRPALSDTRMLRDCAAMVCRLCH